MDEFQESGAAPPSEPADSGMDMELESSSLVESLGELDDTPPEETTNAEPAGATPAKAAEPPPAAAASEAPAGTPPANADPLPASWKKDVAAAWETTPPEVKAEVKRREYEFAREHERLSQSAKIGDNVQQVFAPIAGWIEQLGVNPYQKTQELWNMFINFQSADHDTKLQHIVQFAAEAGLDLSKVGGPAVPDVVMQMQQRMRELEGGVQTANQRLLADTEAKLTAEINDFAANTEKAPHFWDVAPEMAELFRSGKVKTLQQAYETAIWLNPVVRAKELDRVATEKSNNAAREAQKRAEAARKASRANVRSSAGRGASPPSKSVDQTLSETFDAIVARDG